MRFGIFGGARAKRDEIDTDSQHGYADWIEYNVAAEALGFCSTFTVEHHFTGLGQISASLSILTYLAARTTTLRLGTAVMTLPWHNPVLLAEQAAALDVLSGGRLDFGVGKGYRYNEFHGFDIDMKDADAMFEESLALIVAAWTRDARWSHRGRHWRFNDIVVEPATMQKPHPPIWLAAGRPESIRAAARRGANLLLDQYSPLSAVFERTAIFRAERTAMGLATEPGRIAVARALYVAKDAAERDAVIARRLEGRSAMDALAQTPAGDNAASIMAHKGPEEALEGALIGTLDDIYARIEAMKANGIDYVLLANAGGGISGLETFAREFLR